jgi:hypothetical protein
MATVQRLTRSSKPSDQPSQGAVVRGRLRANLGRGSKSRKRVPALLRPPLDLCTALLCLPDRVAT